MKYKDLIRTFGTGLLAAALYLTLTTACTEEDPAGDDTENNGGGGSTGSGTEDDGEGGSTGSDYYSNYTDDDLTYDEAAGVYTIYTERGLYVWARGIWTNGAPEAGAVLAADIELGNDMPDGFAEDWNWGEVDLWGDITFDGAGHTIRGMRIENDHSCHGFFRTMRGGAEVINLTVEGSMRYTGDDARYYAGGIAGECNGGRIENCTFRGTIDGGEVDATGYSRTDLTMIGGIVGYAHDGSTIKGCTAEGTFTAGGSFSQVGGIVGQNYMQSLSQTVIDCHSTEDCHVTGAMAGGIVGYLYGGSTELRDCSSGAEVIGLSEGGGIIGYLDGRGITGCHTTETCRVSSPRYAGGLVGRFSNGCLAGCYSLAEVTGTESESRTGYAGGLVGFGDSDEYIVGCYFAGTAQAPVKAHPFIGHQNYYVYQSAIYASGRVLIGGVEDPSLTNVYYTYMPSTLTEVSLAADGKLDWETTTAELNKYITAYNRDNRKKCEYHFEQTDGTSNPPTLAKGEPEEN